MSPKGRSFVPSFPRDSPVPKGPHGVPALSPRSFCFATKATHVPKKGHCAHKDGPRDDICVPKAFLPYPHVPL